MKHPNPDRAPVLLNHGGSTEAIELLQPATRYEFAMTGLSFFDKTKAKAAYQDFLRLWKGRRPRHPHPIQARKEYDALQ